MPHQCTTCGHSFEDGSKEMLGGCPDCGGNKFQFYPEGGEVPDGPPEDADATTDAPDAPETDASVASTVGRATTKVRDFVPGSSPDPDVPADSEPEGSPHSAPAGDTTPDPDAPWPDEADADPSTSGGDGDIIDADARATERAVEEAEDAAQASARSDVAGETEIAAGGAEDRTGASETDAGLEPSEGAEPPANAESSTDHESTGEGSPLGSPDEGHVVSEPTDENPDVAELREQLNDQFESIKIIEPGQYELNLMELYDREEYIIALQENGRYVIQVPEQWMGDRMEE